MFNWFIDIRTAKSEKGTKARIARLERMVRLKQAHNELVEARKGVSRSAKAVIHAAGKLKVAA